MFSPPLSPWQPEVHLDIGDGCCGYYSILDNNSEYQQNGYKSLLPDGTKQLSGPAMINYQYCNIHLTEHAQGAYFIIEFQF